MNVSPGVRSIKRLLGHINGGEEPGSAHNQKPSLGGVMTPAERRAAVPRGGTAAVRLRWMSGASD